MEQTRDIEKYVQDYLKEDFEHILVKYRRKKVLEILEKYHPENILEIGCGIDSVANYYKNFKKFTIVEPSSDFCKVCVKDSSLKVNIINDFIENRIDELKKENFDFVVLSSLLHEVSNPTAFLGQVASLLNKDTILHINTPNSKSFHLLWAYEAKLIENPEKLSKTAKKFQRNSIFNLNSLKNICSEHFEIIEEGSYFVKPFNHSKMSKGIKEGLLDEKLLDGLYEMTKYMPELGCEIFVNARVKNGN